MGALSDTWKAGKTLVSGLALTQSLPKRQDVGSIGLLLEDTAAKYPQNIALVTDRGQYTWQQVNQKANQFAHYLQQQDINKGDAVALIMENRLEFIVCLMGICKLGAIAGLINTNLTGAPLKHCIELIESKKVVFGAEITTALSEVKPELTVTGQENYIFIADADNDQPPPWASKFDTNNSNQATDNLSITQSIITNDRCFFIFTSGTTGLPKAANFSNLRYLTSAKSISQLVTETTETDRLYNCLPLYHATALLPGFGSILAAGGSMFIRRKFSASNFLNEVRQYQCTQFVYIGELCRYLMNTDELSNDADNPLTTVVGNGLRPDIWMDFKRRYGITRVSEFYGASEGNNAFMNLFNRDLTVGCALGPCTLVRYDVLSDEIIRDKNGFCIPVDKGEPGLLLYPISEKNTFEGYTNKAATNSKTLNGILKQGDSYFNTGDLLKQVDVGFAFGRPHFQFVDRVGDTFRWKGENVSTNEIGEILNGFHQVEIANVYGVQIPGSDGRAGMAALELSPGVDELNFDWPAFNEYVQNNLVSYARPVFIRLLPAVETTATFKMVKGKLREEAYHYQAIKTAIYVLKPKATQYEILDEDYYQQIESSKSGF